MIDENLCRAELSPSDRARQTARRKAIYLELHPETAHGANLEGAGAETLGRMADCARPGEPRPDSEIRIPLKRTRVTLCRRVLVGVSLDRLAKFTEPQPTRTT